jgi:hypothetical protein
MKPFLLFVTMLAVSSRLFFGCSLRSVQKEARIPGTIEYHNQKPVLLAPTIVHAGKDFKIKMDTFGGGCERGGDAEVIVRENTATVKIYDFTRATGPEVMCFPYLARFPHTITLRFTKPGAATIRIEGVKQTNDTPPNGVSTVLEHYLNVTTADVRPDFDLDMPADQWAVTERGFGSIRFGMRLDEAQIASRDGFFTVGVFNKESSCWHQKLVKGPSGVTFMSSSRSIARVEVDSGSVATLAGAKIGDSEKRVKELYPQLKITQRKGRKGHYLTVNPEGEHQLIFETDGKKVIRYSAGRMPEISWIKGCP